MSFEGSGFKQYLKEKAVRMTAAQWNKPNSKTGESRTSILRDKITKGEPLELASGGVVKVDKKSHDEVMKSIAKFETDGKIFDIPTQKKGVIPASDLAKADYFGGGTGAGGGTDNTAIAEACQCLWINALLTHGTSSWEFWKENLALVKGVPKSSYDVGSTTMDQMMDLDESWMLSGYLSAKALIDAKYVTKNMKIHRDSKTMKIIYKKKNEAFKNSNLKKMTDDKWNPGDIWAIEKGFNVGELDTTNISALNNDLLDLFIKKRIVSISLKKVKKSTTIKEENITIPPETESFKVTSLHVKGEVRGTFFSSKGGSIVYDKGKMDIRPNSYMGINKVEIRGKGARGGGAGWGVVQNSAKKAFGTRIPDHKQIKKMGTRIIQGNKKAIGMFHGMAKRFEPSITVDQIKDAMADKSLKIDPGWMVAKLGVLYILYYMDKYKGDKANKFVTSLVNYAGSKSEESSAYIIVKEG